MNTVPYRVIAIVMSCIVFAFGIAILVGAVDLRRPGEPVGTTRMPTTSAAPVPAPPAPAPKPHVQRLTYAEELVGSPGAAWIYRFGGGFPKCWVEMESEGNKWTHGPWLSPEQFVCLKSERPERLPPLSESVEGYIGVFMPTSKEQTYRLACMVTKVKYPNNLTWDGQRQQCRHSSQVKLPDLLPAPKEAKDQGGKPTVTSLVDGEDPRTIPLGEDVELNSLNADTPVTKNGIRVRLWLRFLTPEEVAAVKPW